MKWIFMALDIRGVVRGGKVGRVYFFQIQVSRDHLHTSPSTVPNHGKN